MYERKLFWTFTAMLSIVFLCLVYALFVAFTTWKMVGCAKRALNTLSLLVVLYLACKFVDMAIALRAASDHQDINGCLQACIYAFSHMMLIFACYFNTGTWIKFAITLECLAKGTEQYLGEMVCFLRVAIGVLALLTAAMFCISSGYECEAMESGINISISRMQSLTIFLAYHSAPLTLLGTSLRWVRSRLCRTS